MSSTASLRVEKNCFEPFKFVFLSLVVFVFCRYQTLPGDEDMAEDHGTSGAGQLCKPGPEIVRRKEVTKERAAQKLRSWTL